MSFSTYWKKQEQKKRKSWASKVKRYAEQHTGLENIRKEVFMPLDYWPSFEYDSYKKAHFTRSNPIAVWEQGRFEFSESSLREALAAQGADLTSFRMELERQSICGQAAPKPDVGSYLIIANKGYSHVDALEKNYHRWLKLVYEVCTDVETCTLNYKQSTMIIRRYTTTDLPFAYYELIPCKQLLQSAMLLQETDFYTLNVATLLLEMAAESELRQEEWNYYPKMLRLRSMEAATIDAIVFPRWDDKALEKKIKEYVGKEYTLEKIVERVLRPWRLAVQKYFDAAAECSVQDAEETLRGFDTSSSRSRTFIEGVFCPYMKKEGMEKAGLEDVEVVIENEWRMAIKSQDFSCSVQSSHSGIFFYPNSHYEKCSIKLSLHTPLSAIAGYVRIMPVINRDVDDLVVKAMRIYDRMVLQQKYRDDLVYLEDLMKQSAGKPVGKLMKYLRWNLGNYWFWSEILIQSFKILDDTTFSFIKQGYRHPGITVVKRWLDEECHHVYGDDASGKTETWDIRQFYNDDLGIFPVLSFDFIVNNL